jgi:hypothetical protein
MNGQLLREALDSGALTKHVIADMQELKTYGFQGLPVKLLGEKDFSPEFYAHVRL